MSENTKIQQVVEYVATSMKVVGALMLGIGYAQVAAFAGLVAACVMSIVMGGHRSAILVNGAFAVANGLGFLRATGLLGVIAMNDFIDDFLLNDSDFAGVPQLPEAFGSACMNEIQQRYDVFRNKHRDDLDMHIMGVGLTWEPPGLFLYDWYRSSSGMTVSLESPRSLSRPTGTSITIRVRHEDADRDPTITKLGRTITFDGRDPELLEQVRREILDALCEWEAPLWRLRRHLDLPDFIVHILEEPVDQLRSVRHLELETTKALLLTQLISPGELLDSLHIRDSIYTRRFRDGE